MHSPTWVCLLFVLGFPFRAWEVAGVEFLQPLYLHFSVLNRLWALRSKASFSKFAIILRIFGHPTFSSPSSHALDPILCTHLVVLKATKWQLILANFNQPILRKLPLNFAICDPHCSLSSYPIASKLGNYFRDIYCYLHTDL